METHRNRSNIVVVERNEDYFENKWFAPQLKALSKTAADTTEQQESILTNYSKLALMNEARTYDIFQSDFFLWVDPALTFLQLPANLFELSAFPEAPNLLEKYVLYYPAPWSFTTLEITPFADPLQLPNTSYLKVGEKMRLAFGSLFGGRVEAVRTVESIFENLLFISLEMGQVWSEEVLYTMILQRYPFAVYHVVKLTYRYLSMPIRYEPNKDF